MLSPDVIPPLRYHPTVSISALSDRIAQLSLAVSRICSSVCFNIRSFGSNCSAKDRFLSPLSPPLFQYPLFRIELLSPAHVCALLIHYGVSISALSDRIAQPSHKSYLAAKRYRFNIRSFGSNCSATVTNLIREGDLPFQYPLFRIELLSVYLSPSIASNNKFQYPLFRIELLSALPWTVDKPTSTFQYPLFRIELLSEEAAAVRMDTLKFQYPLFRIELLSFQGILETISIQIVSISALSDRIAQP